MVKKLIKKTMVKSDANKFLPQMPKRKHVELKKIGALIHPLFSSRIYKTPPKKIEIWKNSVAEIASKPNQVLLVVPEIHIRYNVVPEGLAKEVSSLLDFLRVARKKLGRRLVVLTSPTSNNYLNRILEGRGFKLTPSTQLEAYGRYIEKEMCVPEVGNMIKTYLRIPNNHFSLNKRKSVSEKTRAD